MKSQQSERLIGSDTYPKQKLRMTVSNRGSRTAIERIWLDGLVEVVQLFREVQRANQHLIPSTPLMRKGG
jgi:hypothetical protein